MVAAAGVALIGNVFVSVELKYGRHKVGGDNTLPTAYRWHEELCTFLKRRMTNFRVQKYLFRRQRDYAI